MFCRRFVIADHLDELERAVAIGAAPRTQRTKRLANSGFVTVP